MGDMKRRKRKKIGSRGVTKQSKGFAFTIGGSSVQKRRNRN